jgi:hypothetical protein
MSFDDKTDQMNWKDESSWFVVSLGSGFALSLMYIDFQTFPETNVFILFLICSLGFYILSILVRIQNKRGMALTAKPAFDEQKLKFVFPILGFAIGIAILFS